MELRLSDRLTTFGIALESFSIKEVIPTEDYRNAIQLQQTETEKANQKKAETLTAQQEAERKKAEAQGEADAAVIAAQGQAESNAIIGASIAEHPEVLTLEYYEALKTVTWAILSPGEVQPTLPVPPVTPEG
jgi:regulator of protease activity HflC (stomatin/prohibitin superfamily)